jgi:UDP-glucose 4-epimerase
MWHIVKTGDGRTEETFEVYKGDQLMFDDGSCFGEYINVCELATAKYICKVMNEHEQGAICKNI